MRSRTIPIIRVRDALIVSIQIELSDQLVLDLKDEIAGEISRSSAHGLIIEISGVDVVDSFIASSVRDIAGVARLMGVQTIVAGLDAGMAITLVEMGMTMRGVRTALNLDAALTLLEEIAGETARLDAELSESLLTDGDEVAPAADSLLIDLVTRWVSLVVSTLVKQVDRIHEVLERFLSPISARSVVRIALKRRGVTAKDVEAQGVDKRLVRELMVGMRFYSDDLKQQAKCQQDLDDLLAEEATAAEGTTGITVASENDIVRARFEARTMAERLGFHSTDQIKIATAVSELARNICRYAGEGTITLRATTTPEPRLMVLAEDTGPGIPNLDEILGGEYQSKTGLGLGLIGCRRIMDEFSVESEPGKGTTVRASKRLAS